MGIILDKKEEMYSVEIETETIQLSQHSSLCTKHRKRISFTIHLSMSYNQMQLTGNYHYGEPKGKRGKEQVKY